MRSHVRKLPSVFHLSRKTSTLPTSRALGRQRCHTGLSRRRECSQSCARSSIPRRCRVCRLRRTRFPRSAVRSHRKQAGPRVVACGQRLQCAASAGGAGQMQGPMRELPPAKNRARSKLVPRTTTALFRIKLRSSRDLHHNGTPGAAASSGQAIATPARMACAVRT